MRKDYTSADAVLAIVGATVTELARYGKLDVTSVQVVFNAALEATGSGPTEDFNLHKRLLWLEEQALKAAEIAEREREEELAANDDDTPE